MNSLPKTILQYVPEHFRKSLSQLKDDQIAGILIKYSCSQTPVIKGIEAELTFEELLSQSSYIIENVAKSGHMGDFIIKYTDETLKEYRVLVEIKNYAKTVPKAQVIKFYRDIETNTSIDAGFLLSYKSKVVGFNKNISYISKQIGTRKIPLLILSSSNEKIIKTCIDLLFAGLKSAKESDKKQTNIQIYLNKISNKLDMLSNIRNKIDEFDKSFRNFTSALIKDLISCEESIKTYVEELENAD